jgi:hypothetical protein
MQPASIAFWASLLVLIVNALSIPIDSGDIVFLKSGSGFGNHIEAEMQFVHARWKQRAGWQALAIEKTGSGAIHSGDTVFLKTHSGVFIDVEGDEVRARFSERGTWQGLIIEKAEGGAISNGDVVCLLAHTGKHIDVEGASVQARWHDCGAWQQLMVQKEVPSAVPVGATVFLKTFTGTFIDAEAGAVQARWAERGTWQEFVIESSAGTSIFTGDIVYLRSHTGDHLDVEGDAVRARWEDRGNWQALIIEKSVAGPIYDGDVVYLRSHTGKYIDAQGDSTVQARWNVHGAWQSLVIILKTFPASTSIFFSSTTRTTTPSVSTLMSTTEPSSEPTPAPTPAPTLPPNEAVVDAATQIINIISASGNQGDTLGGIVRLAFHDAGSWDGSTGGADGCVELVAPENAGLEPVIAELAPVVNSVRGSLSRADVWALAGNVAVEVSGGPAMLFEVGRRDADSCQGHGLRLPNAELGLQHIRDLFLTRYGFNERETAALIGAHVLGRAEPAFSGYTGSWVPRNDRFSNAFFRDLLARPWIKRSFSSGTNALTQWDGPAGTATMMLNTDLELAFDTSSSTCNIAGGDRAPRGTTPCPRATHAFNDAVTEFADDETGQAAWHAAFAPAFKKLTSLGAGSLQCALPDCSTPGPRIRR